MFCVNVLSEKKTFRSAGRRSVFVEARGKPESIGSLFECRRVGFCHCLHPLLLPEEFQNCPSPAAGISRVITLEQRQSNSAIQASM